MVFSNTSGHFKYRIMPCGLSSIPSVFQRLINEFLRHMLGKFVIAYMDNILIYSLSKETHVNHAKHVLCRLYDNKVYVKGEKCEFHVTHISFLGYIILRKIRKIILTKIQKETQTSAFFSKKNHHRK